MTVHKFLKGGCVFIDVDCVLTFLQHLMQLFSVQSFLFPFFFVVIDMHCCTICQMCFSYIQLKVSSLGTDLPIFTFEHNSPCLGCLKFGSKSVLKFRAVHEWRRDLIGTDGCLCQLSTLNQRLDIGLYQCKISNYFGKF